MSTFSIGKTDIDAERRAFRTDVAGRRCSTQTFREPVPTDSRGLMNDEKWQVAPQQRRIRTATEQHLPDGPAIVPTHHY